MYCTILFKAVFCSNNVKSLLFIPYALRDYDQYVKKIREVFTRWGK